MTTSIHTYRTRREGECDVIVAVTGTLCCTSVAPMLLLLMFIAPSLFFTVFSSSVIWDAAKMVGFFFNLRLSTLEALRRRGGGGGRRHFHMGYRFRSDFVISTNLQQDDLRPQDFSRLLDLPVGVTVRSYLFFPARHTGERVSHWLSR